VNKDLKSPQRHRGHREKNFLKKISFFSVSFVSLWCLFFSGCGEPAWREDVARLEEENDALRQQIGQLVYDVENLRLELNKLRKVWGQPLTGSIIAVGPKGRTYSIDKAAADGVKKGDRFEVLRDGKVLGSLQILDAYKNFSLAKLLKLKDEEQPFKEGDEIRRIRAGK